MSTQYADFLRQDQRLVMLRILSYMAPYRGRAAAAGEDAGAPGAGLLHVLLDLGAVLRAHERADVGARIGGVADGETPLRPGPRIQAVTFDAVRAPAPGTLAHLRGLGVTHLALVSFGFQPGYDVPEIRMHNDARWFSEPERVELSHPSTRTTEAVRAVKPKKPTNNLRRTDLFISINRRR